MNRHHFIRFSCCIGFLGIAGSIQIWLGSIGIAIIQTDNGGIQIGGFILRIHAHSQLPHLIEVLGTYLKGLSHHKQLVERQQLRLGIHNLLCLLHIEWLNLISNVVVAMAESRIAEGEQGAILCRI